MKILYLSAHSVLEYDEIKLFIEMGHDVFPMGAYSNGGIGHYLLPRPAIHGMKHYIEFEKLERENPKTHIPDELIEWADIIIIMHTPEWVNENWDRIKHKKVVWRSIGQSVPSVENMIRRARYEGMKIVRYSPMESHIPDFVGADIYIRFYKNPDDWKDWNGKEKRVMNLTQTLKGRRIHCHYDVMMQILEGFPATVFGSGNDDLGGLNGGDLPYDLMRGQLRDNRVFLYAGTWPAPYTLSFQEAWMTGIPIVSVGKNLAEQVPDIPPQLRLTFFEVPNFVENGVNGFISDDIPTLRNYIHELLQDHSLAKAIGDKGREKAIELFGKDKIKLEWEGFFKTL